MQTCLVFLVMENKKDFPLPADNSPFGASFQNKSLYPPKTKSNSDLANKIVLD